MCSTRADIAPSIDTLTHARSPTRRLSLYRQFMHARATPALARAHTRHPCMTHDDLYFFGKTVFYGFNTRTTYTDGRTGNDG